jgi:SP family sugar:H+ symporter-like MFS transporter
VEAWLYARSWGGVFSGLLSQSQRTVTLALQKLFLGDGTPLTYTPVASSWGPVAWVVTGEIFPLKVRAKSLSMTTASNWLLNWAIAYATPYMVDDGPGNANLQAKVFFVWGGFCFICIAFVYFMIYETKGLSLEQVDELYGKVSQAWKSKGFVPTVSFQDVQDVTDGSGARKSSLTDLENAAMRKKSVQHEEITAEKV